MNEKFLSHNLKSHYKNSYLNGESEWRSLGAIDKANNIIKLSQKLVHNSILEIGAGEGSILNRLSDLKYGQKYFALEISESGVDTIKKRKINGLKEFKIYDGYNIPYNDRKFDIAILSHVLEHVEYPRKLIYEAARVAKHVLVEVPLEDTIRLPNDFTFMNVGHINFYSTKTIRRLIQTCNMKVLNQIITNPSKKIYQFKSGKKFVVRYYIRNIFLRIIPFIATKIFTYHTTLIYKSNYDH
jgi:ubiquinone/menaquinone biosynthesis C-methylase UbiE